MANISLLARVLNGVVQNIDLSVNTLVVDVLKVGGGSGTDLTQSILGRLISLQNGSDVDATYHTHNTIYYTQTQLASATSSSGSDLIGDDNTYTNFTPAAATVKGAFTGIDTALTSINSAIATNTANIATNTSNIATNTANIATNTADIATNTAAIALINGTLPGKANIDLGNLAPTAINQDLNPDSLTDLANRKIGESSPFSKIRAAQFSGEKVTYTITGDVTAGSPLITNIVGTLPSYTGTLYTVNAPGYTGFNDATTVQISYDSIIASFDSPTQITMNDNAARSGVGVTFVIGMVLAFASEDLASKTNALYLASGNSSTGSSGFVIMASGDGVKTASSVLSQGITFTANALGQVANLYSVQTVIDATLTTITVGPLVTNNVYIITNYVAGDDFTNVGGTNVTGAIFRATGTTPTNYTNGSTLQPLVLAGLGTRLLMRISAGLTSDQLRAAVLATQNITHDFISALTTSGVTQTATTQYLYGATGPGAVALGGSNNGFNILSSAYNVFDTADATNTTYLTGIAKQGAGNTATIQIYSGVAGGTGSTGGLFLRSGDNDGSGGTGSANLRSGVVRGATASGTLNLSTGAPQALSTAASGSANLSSGGINNVNSTAQSGSVNINSGNSVTNSSGQTGAVNLNSGNHTGNGSGITGNVTVKSGNKAGATSTGNTGNTNISSGNHSGSGNSGSAALGSGSAVTGVSGNANLTTGNVSAGSGNSGAININTGTSAGGTSGQINVNTGSALLALNSGSFNVNTGSSVSGTSGSISIAAGTSTTGSTGAVNFRGGDISGVTTGSTGSATYRSGDINNAGSSVGQTGNLSIKSGNNSGSGNSGSVTVQSGATTSGNSGGSSLSSGNASGGGSSGQASFGSGSANGSGNSGNLEISSGATVNGTSGYMHAYSNNASGSGNSGDVLLFSGNSVTGATGGATFNTGDITGSASTNTGGWSARTGNITNAGSSGNTGPLNLFTGNNSGSGVSGQFSISTGSAAGSANSGLTTMFTGSVVNGTSGINDFGSGGNSGTAGSSGQVGMRSGDVTGVNVGGQSGNLIYRSGNVTNAGSSANSGTWTARTGDITGTGLSGNMTLRTGNTASGVSGNITINSGNPTAANSGNLQINSGAVAAGLQSGTATLNSGNGVDGGSGNVIVKTGDMSGTGSSAQLALSSGSANTGFSGNVLINSGNVSAGSGVSGGMTFKSGNTNTGTSGGINITSGTGASGANTGTAGMYTGNATGSGISGLMQLWTGSSVNGNSGNNFIGSGDVSGSGASGSVEVKSGNTSNGNSGIILIDSGAVSGTGNSGDINIFSGLPQANHNSGNILLKTSAVSGTGVRGTINLDADQTLPQNDLTQDLGSFTKRWANIRGDFIAATSSIGIRDTAGTAIFTAAVVGPLMGLYTGPFWQSPPDLSISDSFGFRGRTISTGGTHNLVMFTGQASTSGNSGKAVLSTGSATSGNSGNVEISTGTASGTRGQILLAASQVDVNNTKIINVTDPTTPQGAATKNYVDTNATAYVTSIKTVNYTAVNRDEIFANTAAFGPFTITLPASPTIGQRVKIADYNGNWAAANITVARNGSNIMGVATDFTLNVNDSWAEFIYVDVTQGWRALL